MGFLFFCLPEKVYAVIVSLCAQTSGESLLHALLSTTSWKILISATSCTGILSEVLAGLVLTGFAFLGRGEDRVYLYFTDGGIKVRD